MMISSAFMSCIICRLGVALFQRHVYIAGYYLALFYNERLLVMAIYYRYKAGRYELTIEKAKKNIRH